MNFAMLFLTLTTIASLAGIANAHFRLLYPVPRGPFVANDELQFCGNYINAVSNRTQFPLSDGFVKISTSHGGWSAGVLISTIQNPTSFDNFSANGQQQLALPFAKEANGGTFCLPLNLTAANITGVTEGANVTIQVVFAGGDGNLYQCADLTLSKNFTTPSDVTCTNETTDSHHNSSSDTQSNNNGGLGQTQRISVLFALLFGCLGLAVALI